jgi:outer membrane receptor for ferrienterochelin and colicin
MKTMLKRSALCLALTAALGVSSIASANETSSAMRGKIMTPNGEAAANTKILIIHQPSGTTREFFTNDAGTFLAKGLRVGGPYLVTVDSDVYRDTQSDNIFLQLGDTYRFSAQLEDSDLERILVTSGQIFETNGASSTFGADMINRLPSFENDIKDIARLNPLVNINGSGDMTIAGGNPRTNNITVDGIGQNDDFGLNFGGYPTERSPISLSSIAQISVAAAPFSVRKTGFSGGAINAVTKSGTNEFKGSAFYEFTNPDLSGKVERPSQIFDGGSPVLDTDGFKTYELSSVDSSNSQSTLGFSIGGPIIEDKLFFFVDYDQWKSSLDLDYGFEGSGASNEFNTSEDNYNEFLSILDTVYGLTDSLGGDPEDTNERGLVKISWNISDLHRMDFTYQWQDDKDQRNFGLGGNTVSLASSRYVYDTQMNNVAAKFYSSWSDEFSTEFGISLKDVKANSINNSDFGSVKVDEFFRGPAYEFGTDIFRHANASENENLTVHLDANYLYGEHDISFGFEIQRLRLYNLFAENSLGSWEFDSLAGFENREVGNFQGNYDFSYANAYTNNALDTAYDTVRLTSAFYIEDNFELFDNVEVTAGLRYESLSSTDRPTLNANFLETYGFRNQENLDGLTIILPRLSFKWFVNDDVEVRGGLGRFSNKVPNVWYNGPFTKDGITSVAASESVINNYFANTTAPADFTSVPQAIQDSLEAGSGSTNYTDPNFKLPSDWRAQIAVDYRFDIPMLGENFSWTSELLYIKKQNEAVWYNTALNPLDDNGSLNYAADGIRLIQQSIYEGDAAENFDIMMTNSDDDGRSIIFTTSLAKDWDNGMSVSMNYAHQDVTENQVGSSSRNQSNYKYLSGVNRNQAFADTGHYQIEHSFKINLGYNTEVFEGYSTRINLFLERRSGRPFSWGMGMFRDDDFGDTEEFYSNGAYLPYIPNGADDPNVDWDNSVSWDELSTVLDRAGVDACGCILDRNTGRQPWVTTADLSIQQEIPGFVEGQKGTVYFTIANLGNLLNKDWGVERRLSFASVNLYDLGGLSDDGRYQIDPVFRGYDTRNYSQVDFSSAWRIKMGVRYSF